MEEVSSCCYLACIYKDGGAELNTEARIRKASIRYAEQRMELVHLVHHPS